MSEIRVRRYGGTHTEITINDYYAQGIPLVFDLRDDQAAQLRAELSPKLMRYKVTTPAKWRAPKP